jgi:hypothetical protein
MSFQVFDTLLPDICNLAKDAERRLGSDHMAALSCMKEFGEQLVTKILTHENVHVIQSDPFLVLDALIKIDILPVHMMICLKKLTYFDTRESAMFIDPIHVNMLMLEVYDITVWYCKTFVDDQFTPPPLLLKPQNTALSIQSESNIQEEIRSFIQIDSKPALGVWEEVIENAHSIEFEGGETYQGQMINGMKCGSGVYRWSDGSKYKVQWYNDTEYGYGTKNYANGDRYQGEWKDGFFHGQGIYTWNDGTVFEGSWQNHLKHGYGIKTYKNGSVQRGFWTCGELIFVEDQLHGSN